MSEKFSRMERMKRSSKNYHVLLKALFAASLNLQPQSYPMRRRFSHVVLPQPFLIAASPKTYILGGAEMPPPLPQPVCRRRTAPITPDKRMREIA